jgi:hypothetical protein
MHAFVLSQLTHAFKCNKSLCLSQQHAGLKFQSGLTSQLMFCATSNVENPGPSSSAENTSQKCLSELVKYVKL